MAVQFQRRLFTVKDFHRMGEAGIFREDDRVELVAGEIADMAPIGSGHAACVARLTALFSPVQGRGIVWPQNPLRLGELSEVQPDLAFLRPRQDFYASTHPGPEDMLLIVEVAETSLDYDRDVKVPLYARAGIPEVWLVDLAGERVHVYRRPTPQGYQEVQRLQPGARVTSQAVSGLEVSVEEILG